jgi:hypothetical protein
MAMKSARSNLGDWVEAVETEQPMPATTYQGWAKIAWSYGMRELRDISHILKENKNYKLD